VGGQGDHVLRRGHRRHERRVHPHAPRQGERGGIRRVALGMGRRPRPPDGNRSGFAMTGTAAPRDPFAPVARSYEEWFSTPLGGFVDRMELAALDALLPPPGGGRVAEIGAGTGHVSRYLAGRGYRML